MGPVCVRYPAGFVMTSLFPHKTKMAYTQKNPFFCMNTIRGVTIEMKTQTAVGLTAALYYFYRHYGFFI